MRLAGSGEEAAVKGLCSGWKARATGVVSVFVARAFLPEFRPYRSGVFQGAVPGLESPSCGLRGQAGLRRLAAVWPGVSGFEAAEVWN